METQSLVGRIVRTKPLAAATTVVLAVALPYIFHSVGIVGTVALPMHLPVLLMGLLFGPVWGAAVGLLAPAVNTALTGLPPVTPPIMQLMTVELALYGLIAGWARRQMGWSNLQAVAVAAIGGRVGLYLAALTLGPALGLPAPAGAFVLGAVTTGWPGIVLQLVALPFIAKGLERFVDGQPHSETRTPSERAD